MSDWKEVEMPSTTAHASAQLDAGSDSGKMALTDSPRSVATNAETEARAMLEAMDHFKLSWFHIKTVLVAGMGFFCDAYDLFAISLVTKTIGRLYYPDIRYFSPAHCTAEGILDATCGTKYKPELFVPSAMPTNVDSALKAVALCGTFAGQLLFGYLGDKWGRRPVFGFTLWMMVIFAFLSGFSMGSSPTAVVTSLCFFRFFLGMGVGGDYPLSATLMSEYSSKSSRGQFVAAVFAMQGTGILAAAIVTLIISSIFDTYGGNPDYIWRLVLMFGAIPTLLTMYARLNLPETPRYTLFVAKNAQQMVQDMNTVVTTKGTTEITTVPSEAAPAGLSLSPSCSPRSEPFKQFTFRDFIRHFGKALFGCASTWFLLDIAFYSQNLFQTDVFTAAGWLPSASTMSTSEEATKIARAQALLAICSTIPGYWMTVFTIERLGRFKIQMGGFFLMTLFMAILAGDYTNLQNNHVAAFVALYALTFFFANWGPNATTFVIPAEVFPSKFRSFGHGISAAAGKAGAIIGTFGFAYTNTAWGLRTTVGILAVVNVLGLVCTLFVPETKGKSLEELSNDHHFTFGSAKAEDARKEDAQV